jgi:hypothetical protein
MCGFNTTKGVPIEYAGEELIQHTQLVGCSQKVFLEEVKDIQESLSIESVSSDGKTNDNIPAPKPEPNQNSLVNNQISVVDQIIKLASLKEKGIISEQEFLYIKSELIKKLQ